jgi:hypothetical protein
MVKSLHLVAARSDPESIPWTQRVALELVCRSPVFFLE